MAFNTPDFVQSIEESAAHQLLTCEACGAAVALDGDMIKRSCSCPADTEITAHLRATVRLASKLTPATP